MRTSNAVCLAAVALLAWGSAANGQTPSPALPVQWTAHSVSSEVGNLIRWQQAIYEERQATDPRLGLNARQVRALDKRQAQAEKQGQRGPLSDYHELLTSPYPPVTGYFHVADGGSLFPGPHIFFSADGPEAGTQQISLTAVQGHGRCGARTVSVSSLLVTYLGPRLDPAWSKFGRVAAASPNETLLDTQDLAVALSNPAAVERYYPDRAKNLGMAGRAMSTCLILGQDGALACAPLDETPAGYGFAQAATRILRTAKVQATFGPIPQNRCMKVPMLFTLR